MKFFALALLFVTTTKCFSAPAVEQQPAELPAIESEPPGNQNGMIA